MKTPIIYLIFGPICSGKSTYCERRVKESGGNIISVSSIVRQLSGKTLRTDLQNTSDLATDITGELFIAIGEEITEDVYIDGIRQWSIVENILSYYGFNQVRLVWLEVDEETRRSRYLIGNRSKDNSTFDEANTRDYQLGLHEIENIVKNLCQINK